MKFFWSTTSARHPETLARNQIMSNGEMIYQKIRGHVNNVVCQKVFSAVGNHVEMINDFDTITRRLFLSKIFKRFTMKISFRRFLSLREIR